MFNLISVLLKSTKQVIAATNWTYLFSGVSLLDGATKRATASTTSGFFTD